MARKPDPVKPLYSLVHEYEASLKCVLDEVRMMLTMARTLVDRPDSLHSPGVQQMLKERVTALRTALYGKEE